MGPRNNSSTGSSGSGGSAAGCDENMGGTSSIGFWQKSRSPFSLAWFRFQRNRASLVGLWLLVLIVVATSLGPILHPTSPNEQDLTNVLAVPSRRNPLGTDEFGRDILVRLLHGGRVSIALGIAVVSMATVTGTVIGMISGYYGEHVDRILMHLTDILMSFPPFLLALLVLGILGPGLVQAMFAIGLSEVSRFIRIARASTLSVREEDYIAAARAMGESRPRIIWRHVLPNILGPILVQSSLLIGVAILVAASLGFLGLGVQPPTSEWGTMISSGRSYLRIAPHVVIFPGLAIAAAVLAFNLVGDGLRDVLDVQSAQSM